MLALPDPFGAQAVRSAGICRSALLQLTTVQNFADVLQFDGGSALAVEVGAAGGILAGWLLQEGAGQDFDVVGPKHYFNNNFVREIVHRGYISNSQGGGEVSKHMQGSGWSDHESEPTQE